jgi:hypothetical protein
MLLVEVLMLVRPPLPPRPEGGDGSGGGAGGVGFSGRDLGFGGSVSRLDMRARCFSQHRSRKDRVEWGEGVARPRIPRKNDRGARGNASQ